MQDVRIQDLIVSYLLYWLTLWGIGFVGQISVNLYFKVNAGTISHTDLVEIEKESVFLQRVPVKWYLRPLFGYLPRSGTVALRVGILQIGAILFAVFGLMIACFIGFEQLRFLRQVLLWPYLIFVIGVGAFLNSKRS